MLFLINSEKVLLITIKYYLLSSVEIILTSVLHFMLYGLISHLILNCFCKNHEFCSVFLQGNARTLVLMVTSAAVGGTLQYGYNLAIMNAPTVVSKQASVFTCLVIFFMIIITSESEKVLDCSYYHCVFCVPAVYSELC